MHFGIMLDAKIHSKWHQKYHRFWDRFWKGFGSQNDLEIAPKSEEKKLWSPPFCSPKRFENAVAFFDCFGRPLGAIWAPPGLPFHPFYKGLLATHCSVFTILGPFWQPPVLQNYKKGPPSEQRRKSAEEPLQIRRESTKNRQEPADTLPRFRREPAEDPPYEPQTEIFSTLRRLRSDFVPRQTAEENGDR